MQKPENITQAQWEHLMAHLASAPKIEVRETGTTETRMLYSPEDLKGRGAKSRGGQK